MSDEGPNQAALVEPGLESIASVSVGNACWCALRTDGEVVCRPAGTSEVPSAWPAPAGPFLAVAVSRYRAACALRDDETVACWAADGSVLPVTPRPAP